MGRGRGTSDTEKRGERSHVMMKAEAGERRPQAGGHLEAPELEEAGSSDTRARTSPAHIEILGFQAWDGERQAGGCKPPQLGSCVMVTPGQRCGALRCCPEAPEGSHAFAQG